MNVSSKREGRRAAQATFANGLKAVLAAVLTVVLVLQGSNLQAYAEDLLGAQAPEEEVVVSDVVADDETEGEKDDTVVTDEVETESDDEDVVTETESETPPAAETEETEEAETPKATTTSVEPQLLSTTSAQPTNASTRAGGSYTIKIDEPKTLQGTDNIFVWGHDWKIISGSSAIGLVKNGGSATVTGLAEGSATVSHTWWGISSGSETFTVTVKGVNVYFYTLIPNIKFDPNADADTQWNGMGIGSISGIGSPSNYDIEDIVCGSDELKDLDITAPTYPDIKVGDKTYEYADSGSDEAKQANHYTIEWTRLKVASGANAGANGVNKPTVPEGTPTYHLDGRVTLIDEDKIQVGFQVKQPNATEFDDPIAKYYLLYDKNVAYNEIVVPGNEDVPPYKDVNGVQYYFDGWYTDKACTQKVNFELGGTLSENTIFYGRYVPNRDFTVAGGEWLYDGSVHGVTVTGVKAGDKLTYYYKVHGVDSDATTEISASDIQDGKVKGQYGPIDVADSGEVRVTLTRNGAEVASKTTIVKINSRKVTLTSKNLSKEYDGTALRDSANGNCLTVTGDGFASQESYGNVKFTGSQTNAGESENTFTYELNGTNAKSDNYKITLDYGTLTVTKATITVTAEDQTKVEGERDPQLTTTYSGAKNGETPGWTGSVARVDGENPGDYKIMQGTLELADGENGFDADNYDLKFIPGTLTITAADDDDDGTPVDPVDPVDPDDDDEPGDDNPGGGGDDTNPGGGGTTTGGGTNPVPVAVTAGDDADDTDDAEDEEAVEEDETPLTDGTESDSEQIGDDTTPLASGETNEQTCWTHWVMLAGLGVTVVYFALSAARTRRATNELASFEDDVLGGR